MDIIYATVFCLLIVGAVFFLFGKRAAQWTFCFAAMFVVFLIAGQVLIGYCEGVLANPMNSSPMCEAAVNGYVRGQQMAE